MPEQTSLKQRIHRGDILVGVSVPMPIERSRLEDVLSRDTYSFVTVDSQHSGSCTWPLRVNTSGSPPPIATVTKRPRREGFRGLPAALSPLATPST